MSILIGIPTHKRPVLLRECLESIARQEGDLPQVRVFVADNDANDRAGANVAGELANSFRFPLTSAVVEEPGVSAVRNAILAQAHECGADFIAMIDDDETASPGWLVELLKAQVAHGADLVGGPVYFDVQGDGWMQSAFWTDCRPCGPTGLLNATNNVLIATDFLRRADWPQFDQTFGLTGGEDQEWFTRLRALGAKAAWSKSARVGEIVPPERRTMAWFFKRNFRVGLNDVRIARMHGKAKDKALLFIETAARVALLPAFAIGLFSSKRQFNVLRKWARSAGRISALAGVKYREYASRHEGTG